MHKCWLQLTRGQLFFARLLNLRRGRLDFLSCRWLNFRRNNPAKLNFVSLYQVRAKDSCFVTGTKYIFRDQEYRAPPCLKAASTPVRIGTLVKLERNIKLIRGYRNKGLDIYNISRFTIFWNAYLFVVAVGLRYWTLRVNCPFSIFCQ